MPPPASTAPARRRGASNRGSSARRDDDAPLIPILARKVREVEAKAQRGKLGPTNRVKFQVIAFLVREERARVKAGKAPAPAKPDVVPEAGLPAGPVKINNDAVEAVTGIPVTEYAAPDGVYPQPVSTKELEAFSYIR